MATDRTTIIRGPGTILIDSLPLHDASGITAAIETDTQEIPSSISGTLDTIKTDQRATISATPAGVISPQIIAALFPHQTPDIGSSLLGGTDTPLTVHSQAGTKVLFHAAALTGVPELILSPIATAFGQATWTALLAKGKAPGDSGALYTVSTAAYSAGGPNPSGIAGVHYSGTYGQTTIADTLDGWRVQVELGTEPVSTDSLGTVDLTLSSVTVRASCTPIGMSESALAALLPATLARGSSLGTADLVISGVGGLTVTLKNASIVTGPLAWGSSTLRIGQVGFIARRSYSGSIPGALYTVAQAGGGGGGA